MEVPRVPPARRCNVMSNSASTGRISWARTMRRGLCTRAASSPHCFPLPCSWGVDSCAPRSFSMVLLEQERQRSSAQWQVRVVRFRRSIECRQLPVGTVSVILPIEMGRRGRATHPSLLHGGETPISFHPLPRRV